MPTIKKIIVEKMKRITLIMIIVILILSAAVQIYNKRQQVRQDAERIFVQVAQILDENSRELEQIRAEYDAMCLNDARTVAYILEYNPQARYDRDELCKIADSVEVDEIHIFDTAGTIVGGTHPIYYGMDFESGEQIGFFKPLLTDKSLEMVQDVMPNTAEEKQVQYSALWSEDRSFIVQVGMYPETLLRATEKNELSYIFSLLRTGIGYNLYAIDTQTLIVAGATNISDTGKNISEIGLKTELLRSERAFHANLGGTPSHCFSRQIGENYIVWATPSSEFVRSIITNEFLLLTGLALIALILVYAVAGNMDRAVIEPIRRVNEKLRSIQDGDLTTEVSVRDSKEFVELSTHISGMVASLLQNSRELELAKEVESQKEVLERQREQLEAAVEAAETANNAKSEFLFNMSHDIRTPMNAILGFTNLALESGDPQVQLDYLKSIDISSRQLLDIVNNILELAKLEKHQTIIEEELANINDVCARVCTIFDNDLKEKDLSFSMSLNVSHPYLYIDTTHYSKILLNLISNAVNYTPRGGMITVSLREHPSHETGACSLETVIQDNGIGISEEFLAHAFESFARERNSTISGVPGAGLGLAIVKDIVDLMKGSIRIESQVGQGTTVTVCLPYRPAKAPESKAQKTPATSESLLKDRRILLAEDIDVNALVATRILTKMGCLIDRAKDGVECVDLLLKAEDDYYDLVLMDIQMPNMDGYRATQTIRALEDRKKAGIPILAMTANAFQEDRDKAVAVGMNGHIAKPIDPAGLFQAMADVLTEGA